MRKLKQCSVIVFATLSAFTNAAALDMDGNYISGAGNSLDDAKIYQEDVNDLAVQAMDESYTALYNALASLRSAYKAAKINTPVADLAWTGTYDCSNYKNNEEGTPEYNYADYSTHWADGVKPTLDNVRTISVPTSSVIGLDSSDGWSSTAECTLYSLQFDNF